MESISVDGVLSAAGAVAIPVPSTTTVYSNSFKLDYATKFAVQYQAASVAGSVDLKLELEEGNVLPATEGASDANFVVPDGGMTIVANITTETVHIISLAPVVSKYARFKITGQGSNNADATIALKIIKTEEHS
jgi:hypothetical protein